MIMAGIYSFNEGQKIIESKYPRELAEVTKIIKDVDSEQCKTKTSKEKTKPGQLIYSPPCLNKEFKTQFTQFDWHRQRVQCKLSNRNFYIYEIFKEIIW
jgi:NifB/MoaA-like Fe-S oxidoreductase